MDVKHHFVIKYKSDEERIRLSDMILKLIHSQELGNFEIEESYSIFMNKIIYNSYTLVKGNNIEYEELIGRFKDLNK